MRNSTHQSIRILSVFTFVLAILLSGCSDDKKQETQVAAPKPATVTKTIVGNNKNMTPNTLDDKEHYQEMSKPLDKASWVEKGKFKKEFSKDCINRELKNAAGGDVDRAYIEKTCDCIADYMDEHLTDQEAEEFLGEDNHMRALQIRYDTAAYQCIQGADKVAEPKITKFN